MDVGCRGQSLTRPFVACCQGAEKRESRKIGAFCFERESGASLKVIRRYKPVGQISDAAIFM